MEIERKFLTKKIPFALEGYAVKEIRQSYISFHPTIRIRQSNDSYFLTVKGKGHLVREEFELQISREEYEVLEQKTEGKAVRKKRYLIPLEEGLTAELDVYEGELEGLLTTEVEFPSLEEADKFQPPLWFGRDVSHDKRFKNTALALYGMPPKE